MRRVANLIAAILFAVVSIATAYLAVADIPEGLGVDRARHDFGRRYQGDVVKTQFDLTNQSSEPIEIVRIRAQCDCTTGSLDRKTLVPGESVPLETIWRIGGKRGLVTADLWLEYQQGSGSERQLWQRRLVLSADVLPDILYSPSELRFTKDTKAQQRVAFRPGRMTEFELIEARCTHRAFQARLLEDEQVVDVDFDPSLWTAGQSKQPPELIVTTTSVAESLSRIPLRVQ